MSSVMDPIKKRKLEQNDIVPADSEHQSFNKLTPSDVRKIIERFNHDQLLDILQDAVLRHADVLGAVRSVADADVTQRKLFIRGLGYDTATDGLRNLFSTYGELEEAVVILDKVTGKSKGYGFVTFKHVDGALLALKEPSKMIDGRVTVTQLAAAGNSGSNSNPIDISLRKIYVANVPPDLSADKLLAHFSFYGEIEEGPLGFDKQTGKSKGFALFVYKTAEGAQAALVDPVKMVEGKQLNCKLAMTDNKKGKQGGGADGVYGHRNGHGDGMVMPPPPSSVTGQYGGAGGLGSYSGYGGALPGQPPIGNHPMNPSYGGPGLTSMGNQPPSSLGVTGGYGSGLGGHFGSYGVSGAGSYGGLSGSGAGIYGGGSGAGFGASSGGLSGATAGSAPSLYRLPPSSTGMPSSAYPETALNSLSSSAVYPGQQPAGASPVPRVPTGGIYPNAPPYF